MNKIESWIVDWFDTNTDAEKNELIENMNENYFLKGWIDSFKFISFISEIKFFMKIN